MLLVADAGSTKIRWAVARGESVCKEFETPGLNPALISPDEVRRRLEAELLPHIAGSRFSAIRYYGAGCLPHLCPGVARILADLTGCSDVLVAGDMLGAARSLCGHKPGVACILGTGSNSCLFDGTDIVDSVPALGYILGDEGSGAVIGRRFLGDLYRRRFPAGVGEDFDNLTGLSMPDVIENVYRRPAANRFLASLMPAVATLASSWPEVDALVVGEFRRFITRNVAVYAVQPAIPVNFTGSVAWHFATQLRKALSLSEMICGTIVRDPLPGIVAYHALNEQ